MLKSMDTNMTDEELSKLLGYHCPQCWATGRHLNRTCADCEHMSTLTVSQQLEKLELINREKKAT